MFENKPMLGTFISERRKALGITQKQLAEKLGITGKAVSKWETLDANPDIGLLLPLAEALQVTADELLRGVLNTPGSDTAVDLSDTRQSFAAADPVPEKSGTVQRILLPIAGAILALPALLFLLSFLISLIVNAEEMDVTNSELIVISVFSVILFCLFTALSAICFLKIPNRRPPIGFVHYRDLPGEEQRALIKQFNLEYRGLRIACIILCPAALVSLLGSILLWYFHPGTLERIFYGIGAAEMFVSHILTLILIKKRKAWFALRKTQI